MMYFHVWQLLVESIVALVIYKCNTTRDTAMSDLYLEIDRESHEVRTKLWQKTWFQFSQLTFHLYVATFQQLLHYWNIYMSQLMQYSKGCCSYPDFLDWGLLLTKKLLNQIPSGYVEFNTDQDLLLSSWSWLGCLIWNMLEVITYITFQ